MKRNLKQRESWFRWRERNITDTKPLKREYKEEKEGGLKTFGGVAFTTKKRGGLGGKTKWGKKTALTGGMGSTIHKIGGSAKPERNQQSRRNNRKRGGYRRWKKPKDSRMRQTKQKRCQARGGEHGTRKGKKKKIGRLNYFNCPVSEPNGGGANRKTEVVCIWSSQKRRKQWLRRSDQGKFRK